MIDKSKDIITSNDYNESNPIYQKIKNEFTNKLKDKYNCENFDDIVKYVFDFVFKDKLAKSVCIEKLNSVFKGKASDMVEFLWKITRDAEKGQENDFDSNDRNPNPFYKKGGKQWTEKFKGKGRNTFDNKQKYYKNKRDRDRSRSYSRDSDDNKYEYENCQTHPMRQKGFYPPKGTFGGPMMPIGGGYPPYYPPQMMPPFMR